MAVIEYEYEYFKITRPREYVVQVEIDRAAKLNAFIEVMWLNLSAIFKRFSHDPDIRCIMLTGAGERAFTAGLDVQATSISGNSSDGTSIDGARRANAMRRHILEFQECITAIEKCEKPVIAVLHGISYGLALDIAVACDIRICAATTRFAVKEVDIGIAADIGSLTRLPHANIPMSFIKDVALTARDFTAEEALRVGLVSDVCGTKAETLVKALDIAAVIATKSPVAVVGTKELLNYSRDHTVVDGLNYTAVWNAAYLQTRDVKDALAAALEKRRVKFSKL